MSLWHYLRAWLRDELGVRLPQPGPLVITNKEQIVALRYTFALPAEPSIDDFDRREANVSIEGGESDVHTIPKGSAEFTHDFDRDKVVTITLVDVDTSGNKSAPSTALTFTSTDTVPPPQPGGLTVKSIEQV